MIALKIISTVFIAISFITSTLSHVALADDDTRKLAVLVAYSFSWRILVLITLWVI